MTTRRPPGASPLPAGYDQLVDDSPDLDRFCSSGDWLVPAAATWSSMGTVVVEEPGVAALALGRTRLRWGAELWCGLDPVWGFACPVVGRDTDAAAALTARCLAEDGRWAVTLLTGVVPGSARERSLVAALGDANVLLEGPSMTRRVADLDGAGTGSTGTDEPAGTTGGVDAWFGRRSATFRRNLRRAERARVAAGVDVEVVRGGGAEVVERCVALESASWKGRGGSGLRDPVLAAFYRHLAERLAPSGRLRSAFARHEGRDVAYILGAVRHCTYRGLQLSYDDRYSALSLGNVLQLRQMVALAAEGIRTYDLGMDMPYKLHWADRAFTTRTIVVRRRP